MIQYIYIYIYMNIDRYTAIYDAYVKLHAYVPFFRQVFSQPNYHRFGWTFFAACIIDLFMLVACQPAVFPLKHWGWKMKPFRGTWPIFRSELLGFREGSIEGICQKYVISFPLNKLFVDDCTFFPDWHNFAHGILREASLGSTLQTQYVFASFSMKLVANCCQPSFGCACSSAETTRTMWSNRLVVWSIDVLANSIGSCLTHTDYLAITERGSKKYVCMCKFCTHII